jgi:hypothetical protein
LGRRELGRWRCVQCMWWNALNLFRNFNHHNSRHNHKQYAAICHSDHMIYIFPLNLVNNSARARAAQRAILYSFIIRLSRG